jgi:hypothetical protein
MQSSPAGAIAKPPEPSNPTVHAMASSLAGSGGIALEWFGFASQNGQANGRINVAKASSRGEPKPQAERHQRNRADAGKPQCCEPQQALHQRARILRWGCQW